MAIFNQIGRLFNLEKKFSFFFQSDFNDIVNHKKFLELDVSFLLKILQQPNFPRWYVTTTVSMSRSVDRRQIMSVYSNNTKKIIIAVNKWVNNNIGERKKYWKVIIATVRQFLDKKKLEISLISSGRN